MSKVTNNNKTIIVIIKHIHTHTCTRRVNVERNYGEPLVITGQKTSIWYLVGVSLQIKLNMQGVAGDN